MDVPIDSILESPLAMRYLDKTGLQYLQLRDSIAHTKWVRPLTVRVAGDKYELIHGLYRLAICRELGHTTIPVQVVEADDDEALRLTIAEMLAVEHSPLQIAQQIRRIAARHPNWTLNFLAGELSQTPRWIRKHLDLLHLDENLQRDLEAGRIGLQSAMLLSKCPKDWQQQYREEALILRPAQLRAMVEPRLREFNERLVRGQVDMAYDFKPRPEIRKLKNLVAALDNPALPGILNISQHCKTLNEAFLFGIAWALRLDPDSVEQQRLAAERRREQTEQDAQRQRRGRIRRVGRSNLLFPDSSNESEETQ